MNGQSSTTIDALIGVRVLVKIKNGLYSSHSSYEVTEIKIIEVSPSH